MPRLSHNESGHFGLEKNIQYVITPFLLAKTEETSYEAAYVKTCHTCQMTVKPNQSIPPAPLFPLLALSQPFESIIVDCKSPATL